MEKRKLLSQGDGRKKSDDDDDDADDDDDDDDGELADNDDRIYRDEKNKTVPAFKTNRDRTLNELANHAYDLNKL